MSIDVSDLMTAIAKRKCAVCGEQARVFSLGEDDEPDTNLCFAHARNRWPWESEVEPQARGSVAV
jgi:hypothetical protein